MKIEIDKIEMIEEFDYFENNSSKHTDIILERSGSTNWYLKNKESTFFLYFNNFNKIYKIEYDMEINKIEISENIKKPKKIIKGEVLFKKIEYNSQNINNKIIFEKFLIRLSNNRLVYYFTKNEIEIDYGIQISKEITILVGDNNIMKGVLIDGKFKIENDRFYYEK